LRKAGRRKSLAYRKRKREKETRATIALTREKKGEKHDTGVAEKRKDSAFVHFVPKRQKERGARA